MIQVLVAVAILLPALAHATTFTCRHPDVSRYGWGQAPTGCDAEQYGTVRKIRTIYPDYVLDRRGTTDEMRAQYITNIQNLIRRMAHDYYLARNPRASRVTVATFERAMLAVAHQESFMSHYRIAPDGRYKLMTGDRFVSHGMMQVNQNFHASRERDTSFDLVGNITSALDTYYTAWNRAGEQACFAQMNGRSATLETQLKNRARSAYSAYNGGPGAICRYSNSRSPYRSHDDAYKLKFEEQRWTQWNREPNRPIRVNIACLQNGDDQCAVARTPSAGESLIDRPLVYANGLTCVTRNGVALNCARDLRLFTCLVGLNPRVLQQTPLRFARPAANQRVTVLENRDALCARAVEGLFRIGESIIVKREVTLRDRIGGTTVGESPAERVYQVLDYEIRLDEKTDRYYRVRLANGVTGWIYGGANEDRDRWVMRAPGRAGTATSTSADASNDSRTHALPRAGQTVEIVKAEGIRMRDATTARTVTRAGRPVRVEPRELRVIPRATRVRVDGVVTSGRANDVYLQVTVGGQQGYIYVGHTFPELTLNHWIRVRP